MAPAPRFSPAVQEQLIIDAAISAIEQSSLLDFSMSKIAKLSGLSMGSVYKFVQCKEDVLIALATKMYQKRQGIFKQVLSLPLTTPERIIATSLLDYGKVQMFGFDDQLESMVNNRAVMNRCSPRWVDHMISCGQACETIFNGFLTNAANTGELISGECDIEEICLGTWSLAVGYFHTVRIHKSWQHGIEEQEEETALEPDNVHIRSLQRLINTYNWQKPIKKEDILKTCQCLSEHGLR